MGYYSEVVLVVTDELNSKIKNNVNDKLTNKEDQKHFNFLFNEVTQELHDNGFHLYYWSSIKWYTKYPEVQYISDILNPSESDNFNFIRIGEDFNDIEFIGDLYNTPFNVYLNINVTFNGKEEL